MMIGIRNGLAGPSGLAVARAVVAVAVSLCACFGAAGSAYAEYSQGGETQTMLAGDLQAVNRCPVENATMLAADGLNAIAACVGESSPSGSVTLGNLTVATKASNHQLGLVYQEESRESTVAAPAGGVLVDEPVQLPGGLSELVCPSHEPLVWGICRSAQSHGRWGDALSAVTWTMESAGVPYFNLLAGLFVDVPFASVPIKVHLQNPLLGEDCYIGSDTEPVVFQPVNMTPPEGEEEQLNAQGAPVTEGVFIDLHTKISVQSASGFAVPAASGCGFHGVLDQAIDRKAGLPSPSGSANTITFNEASSNLVFLARSESVYPNDGREFAKAWDAAIVPPAEDNRHEHWSNGRPWSRQEAEEHFGHWFGQR